MKTCTKCSETKPLDAFYKAKTSADGRHGSCKLCFRVTESKRYFDNRDRAKAVKAKYASANADKMRAYKKEWTQANEDEVRMYFRHWRKKNSGKVRAYRAKRRATQIQRTPAWADHAEIARIYAECPKGYHVDHVFPLNGAKVSGLHVAGNLQYLPASTNLTKGNKYEPC